MLAHASTTYQNYHLSFSIDDTQYTSAYPNDRALYTMQRSYENVKNKVIYDGGYITFFKNDSLQPEGSFPYQIIERSIYGLLYSLSIPHNLNSTSIALEQLEDVTIRSKPYYVLKATSQDLQEEKDNTIILYASKKDYTLEYVALDYNALALQKQFRRLTNPRRINTLLFQDVTIFVATDSTLALKDYYTHYNNPQLKHTKTIELQNIEVKELSN